MYASPSRAATSEPNLDGHEHELLAGRRERATTVGRWLNNMNVHGVDKCDRFDAVAGLDELRFRRLAASRIDEHGCDDGRRHQRALLDLHEPGRSERMFGSRQDRLVKALALDGIADMAGTNRYTQETSQPAFNAEFAHPAREAGPAFVPMCGTGSARTA